MKDPHDPQIKTIRRILAELAEMSEHASMTGSLKGGAKQAAQAYNGALAALRAQGLVPDEMFESLDPAFADYGQIGVQSRLLLAVLGSKKEEREERRSGGLESVIALAPFLNSSDLSQLVRERMGEGSVPDGLLVGLAPFLDSETLGQIVRRGLQGSPAPPPPMAPAPPAPPTPPADLRPATVENLPTSLEDLIAELRRPELPPEERKRIATRLMELTHEL